VEYAFELEDETADIGHGRLAAGWSFHCDQFARNVKGAVGIRRRRSA
jgi:hypothetical protein